MNKDERDFKKKKDQSELEKTKTMNQEKDQRGKSD